MEVKYYNNNTLVDTADAVIEDGYWTYTIPETITQTTDDYIRVAQHVGTIYSQYILGNMEFEEPTLELPTITMPDIGASSFSGTCTEPNTDVYVTLDREGELIIDDERAASDGQSWLMVMPGSELIENGDVIEAYHLKANGEYSDETTLTVTGSTINAPLYRGGAGIELPEFFVASSYAEDEENDVHVYAKFNNGEQVELEQDGIEFFILRPEGMQIGDPIEYWQVVNGTSSLHIIINVYYGPPDDIYYSRTNIRLHSQYKTDQNTVECYALINNSTELHASAQSSDHYAWIDIPLNDGDQIEYWLVVDGVRSLSRYITVLFIG